MKVSIIGAGGSVGGPAAFYIAASGLAEEVVLLGRRANVIEQNAMDLSTAVCDLGIMVKAGSDEDLAGSDVVINAAGVPQGLIADRMEMLPKNLPLVTGIARTIKRYCPRAFVITATNPVDPLNYATWRAGGFDRRQVIGYSLNDSTRFREMVARARGVKVRQVEATVLGEHGSTQVLLFSSVKIDGESAHFTEEEKAHIHAQVPLILKRYEELQAGRTAGWTCALGLARIVRAITEDSGALIPCSCVLAGEYGLNDISMSVPAVLGEEGVRHIEEWPLAPDEEEGLARTAAVLTASANVADEFLARLP
jgi:malate dehydrogenase